MTHTRIVTAARVLKAPALEAEATPKAPDLDRFADPATREAYFTNQQLRDLYGALIGRLLREPGLFVLVGEKGIGKTALVERLAVEIERAGTLVVRQDSLGVSSQPVGLALARALDVAPSENQSPEAFSGLREAVALRARSGRPVVLVIDRAETLGADALHSLIDLLASPESVPSGMRILLSGRPELAKRLALPAYAALLEQERWRGEITRLSEDDLASLVWHRLRRCGIAESHLFDARSIDALTQLSKGVPGRAIAIARTALEQALAAGWRKVPPALVARTAQNVLTLAPPVAKRPTSTLRLVGAVAVTLLAAGIGLSLVLTSNSERVARAFDSIAATLAGAPRSPRDLTTSAQAGAFDEKAGPSRPETPLYAPAEAAHPGTSAGLSPSSEPSSEKALGGDGSPSPDAPRPQSTALDEAAAAAVEGSSRGIADWRAAGESGDREAGEMRAPSTGTGPADGSGPAVPAAPPAEEESRALPEPAPAGGSTDRQSGASLLSPDDVAGAELAPLPFGPLPSPEEEEREPPIRAAASAIPPPATDQAPAEMPDELLGADTTAAGEDDTELLSAVVLPGTEAVRPASNDPAADAGTPALHLADLLKAGDDEELREEAAAPPLDAPAAVVAEPADTVPAPPAAILAEADTMPPEAEASSAGAALRDASDARPAQASSPAQASESAPSSRRKTAMLVERGNALLDRGDVSGARLLYIRAAMDGDPDAAFAAGKTYDRAFLARMGVQGGVRADPEKAAAWYRWAADLGSAEASARLQAIADGEPG